MDLLKPSLPNSSPLTPLGFLERAAMVYNNCTSVIYNTTSYTWHQTYRRCLQLAASLASLGIKPGHVVSVLAPNIPATYELHFAVPMCGAILNTLNTRLDARTISVLLRHSESKLVFVDSYLHPLLLQALSLTSGERQTLHLPSVVIITETEFETRSPTVDHHGPITYEDLVQMGDAEYKWVRPENEWSPMVLNYTSGTTAAPKGVVHCHRGLYIATLVGLIECSIPKRPVYLWSLPMFHANGWCFTWAMAAVGGTNICIRKVDAATVYGEIRRHGVTHMCGAPVVLNMLTNDPTCKPLANPVHIFTGGAPPPPAVLQRVESLGFIVDHVYGLTETGGVALSCEWKPEWDNLPASDRARLKARQGVRTIGMDDVDVAVGESGTSVKRDGLSLGEVVVRGGYVMLGYLKDPIGTENCMGRTGWLYTGDVGVVHPDGYIEIKDRSKDVIISGGENINSVEVESVLYSHRLVNEAAVVARPDEFWGETPCAFVSLKTESEKPTESEIIEFCRARMPHYMAPKTVIFKEELPKTSTGKIQKYVLREIAKALDS